MRSNYNSNPGFTKPMKSHLVLILLIFNFTNAYSQGTVKFFTNLAGGNQIPPNGSTGDGEGEFTLSGNSLSFLFSGVVLFQDFATPTDITINGPANSSSTASVLFDLGAPNVFLIQPPPGRGYSLQGVVNNLTGSQINDLCSGLWYANIFTASGNFPDGEIRGQITPVPEPATTWLLVAGMFCLVNRVQPRR